MFTILNAKKMSPNVKLLEIEAPLIARKAEPGQFIILRIDEQGERIPLTIADYDAKKGSVTIIFQEIGKTTKQLSTLGVGDKLLNFVGPMGTPSDIENIERAIVVGGGLGTAIAYPQAKALHKNGASVDTIVGFKNKDYVFFEDELKACSDNLYIATDDGSYGEKGFVTDILKRLLDDGNKYEVCIAIGPLIMMKVVSNLTKKYNLKTVVSMNPIMIDGTGMCGCCRVTVGGETKFACVDGPDFDGHLVDFDEAMRRQTIYRDKEAESLEKHECPLNKGDRIMANMSATKIRMPEQNPDIRKGNFKEVALGYTNEQAVEEATRCLNCKNKPCMEGCPVNVKIPEFIELVVKGDFDGAYSKIRETNSLPAVCGRVCPQEVQCESRCVRGIKGEPVAIGRLERFAADHAMKNASGEKIEIKKNGHRIAIIGSGPSSLTCAGDLGKLGYDVTVFEALHTPGGVLVYGIPEFRLPKDLVRREIDTVRSLGVDIQTDSVIGKLLSLEELRQMGYEAIFVGTGAGLPSFMNMPGENLNGVYSSNEFLTRINLMKAYDFPNFDTPVKVGKNVAVVGGGNVAMDSARCAKRMGAENVYIVYRRSEAEMPARAEEVHHAKEEGIIFKMLTNPTQVLGDDKGWVTGLECVDMILGEPDASGRRRPIENKGSEHVIDVETVIIAIGQTPNPLIKNTTKGLETNRKGCIVTDDNGKTSLDGVYAGGDTVTGAATVILAMGAGKKAAAAIDEYIKSK